MSQVAQQFNIMAETLRRGIAGMADAETRAKSIETQRIGMQYEHELRQEDREFRREQAAEEKRRYEQRREDVKYQRQAAEVSAKQEIEDRKAYEKWQGQAGGSATLGFNIRDINDLNYLEKTLHPELEKHHNITAQWNPERKDFDYMGADGKPVTNKALTDSAIAWSLASVYDPSKHIRSEITGQLQLMEEIRQRQPGGPADEEMQQRDMAEAQANLRKMENTERDIRAHPSKWEYLKTQRMLQIYSNMGGAQQRKFKMLMDAQIKRADAMIDLDIANGKASGQNRVQHTMWKNGVPIQVSTHKSEDFAPGHFKYDFYSKQGYTTKEPTKVTTADIEAAALQNYNRAVQTGDWTVMEPMHYKALNKYLNQLSEADIAKMSYSDLMSSIERMGKTPDQNLQDLRFRMLDARFKHGALEDKQQLEDYVRFRVQRGDKLTDAERERIKAMHKGIK